MSTYQHGGQVVKYATKYKKEVSQLIDFSSNINPYGPPDWIRSTISKHIDQVIYYPEYQLLIRQASKTFKEPENQILFGNGVAELLYIISKVFQSKRAVIPIPSYHDYLRAAQSNHLNIHKVKVYNDDFTFNTSKLQTIIKPNDIIYIGSPNNPTGSILPKADCLKLAKQNPKSIFIIDESFKDFVPNFQTLINNRPDNVIILYSLTKILSIPGLRIGLAFANPSIVKQAHNYTPPWNINSFASAVTYKALKDKNFISQSVRKINRSKSYLLKQLKKNTNVIVYPVTANFILIKLINKKVEELEKELLKYNILIRNCNNFLGLEKNHVRIAVKSNNENNILLQAFQQIFSLKKKGSTYSIPKKIPAIMIQGTTSNAGKTLITAALCRILALKGINVSPFKSQNMSLNSYVTKDNLEISKAQSFQAYACYKEPHVYMNPILLKPNSEYSSQVIQLGKPIKHMTAVEYFKYKKKLWPIITNSYDQLAKDSDVIIIEGAGSPAEINLKKNDIVNMKIAEYATANVLLVSNIEQGGLFASIIGTLDLLPPKERKLIKGIIINNFRGDSSLLKPGIKFINSYSHATTLGIVPHIPNLCLPEEDSFRVFENKYHSSNNIHKQNSPSSITIGFVSFPHLSNMTDLEPFLEEPNIFLKKVKKPQDLQGVEVLILPGSKNTLYDLNFLHQTKLTNKILQLVHTKKINLIGICGGFQMLGTHIQDPSQTESYLKENNGLGLIKMNTILQTNKTTKLFSGIENLFNHSIEGYEIHHGMISQYKNANILVTTSNSKKNHNTENRILSLQSKKYPHVWGTYIHGLFDNNIFRHDFLNSIRKQFKKPIQKEIFSYNINISLNLLAKTISETCDMKIIYQMLKL